MTFWADGGNTNLDQLVLLCGPHHNAVHAGVLQIKMRDGVPYVRSRTTLGRQREWTRNRLHDHAQQASRLGAQLRLDHQLDLNPRMRQQLRAAEHSDSDPPDGKPPPSPE